MSLISIPKKVRVIIIVALVAVLLFFIVFRHEQLTPDVIILLLLAVTVLLGNVHKFILDWIPVFGFYFAYEFIRAHLSELQNLLHISVHNSILFRADSLIFGKIIPVQWAQSLIQAYPTFIDYIAFIWYTSIFLVPFVAGYIFWIKDRKFFNFFRNTYLIICIMALATFLIFPAAPPWMASQLGILPPLITNTWGRLDIGSFTLGMFKVIGTNPVAPFPSLHIGWSFLIAYMLQKFSFTHLKKNKNLSWLFFLYPLIMCFVVTYTTDHYVIDMIGGLVYALIAIYISNNGKRLLKKLPRFKLELVDLEEAKA